MIFFFFLGILSFVENIEIVFIILSAFFEVNAQELPGENIEMCVE